MSIYEYKALAKTGKIKTGIVDADTPKDARSKLRSEGIHVVDISQLEQKKSEGKLQLKSFRRKANVMELAMVTRQLATLIESDIKLREAIGVLIDQVESRSMQMVFRDIREKITAGSTFADALAQHPQYFNDLYVHMVRAGEAAGNLDVILNKLSDYLQAQSRMRGKVSAALAYPLMMMFIGGAVIIFLMTFVVPKIQQVIESQGKILPTPTKILIFCSEFCLSWWWAMLFLAIAAIVGFRIFISKPFGRKFYDRFCISIPVLGMLFKKQAVSRFAVTFSTLLQSGIPALRSLQIVRNVVNNIIMAETIDKVQTTIIEGGEIATTLRKSPVFPPMVGYMISVGEQSGNLEKVLTKIADAYDEEVEITTQKVTSLMEPIMIVALSAIVGFVVLAIILPILDMSRL